MILWQMDGISPCWLEKTCTYWILIAVAELEYGAFKSNRQEASRAALHGFVLPFDIVPFYYQDAEYFGLLRADLERRGLVIGVYDMQIAAQALRHNLTVITNNTGELPASAT